MRMMHPTKLLLAMVLVGTIQAGQSALASTIAQVKALAIPSAVTINNVVISNTIDLVNSASVANFQVQDGTDGITVFGSTAEIATLLTGFAAGDRVDVSGSTTRFNGLFELQGVLPTSPLTLSLVTAGVGVPTPAVTTTADFQNLSATAEGLESRLASLANVHFTGLVAGQMFVGSTNYTVSDGVNSVSVRVSTTTQSLVGDLIPTGQVNLSGVVSQFDSGNPLPGVAGVGYQLLLLDDASIKAVPEPASIVLAALGLAGIGAIGSARPRSRR